MARPVPHGTEGGGGGARGAYRTSRGPPFLKRKWPYLDTIGLPEANDRCILHVSASSTTFVFLKKSKNRSRAAARTPARRPDPRPASPGLPEDLVRYRGEEGGGQGVISNLDRNKNEQFRRNERPSLEKGTQDPFRHLLRPP